MMAAMLTITLTESVVARPALVVVDPHDESMFHAHGECGELVELIDLVERVTGACVDDPDAFDAALVDLGLALPFAATVGLRSCPECWGN